MSNPEWLSGVSPEVRAQLSTFRDLVTEHQTKLPSPEDLRRYQADATALYELLRLPSVLGTILTSEAGHPTNPSIPLGKYDRDDTGQSVNIFLLIERYGKPPGRFGNDFHPPTVILSESIELTDLSSHIPETDQYPEYSWPAPTQVVDVSGDSPKTHFSTTGTRDITSPDVLASAHGSHIEAIMSHLIQEITLAPTPPLPPIPRTSGK